MILHKLDIIFIQEHNIKDGNRLEYLEKYCKILINYSQNLKGGVAILINNVSNVDVLNSETDVNGLVISALCKVSTVRILLLNVYAPSGTDKKREREQLFDSDILYFLRNNISNIIMGGDWNCITSPRDCSNSENDLMSKSLLSLKNNLKLKDAWFSLNHHIEYTYLRPNYGSRLDRFYVKDFQNNIASIQTIPVSWSDHCSIKLSLKLENVMTPGKGYWKLNCSILDHDIIENNFGTYWECIQKKKHNFDNILEWWKFAKSELKNFFIRCSKQINKEKYGLLNLLNYELRNEMEKMALNPGNLENINKIKLRINDIQNDICEGIKVRAKVDDHLKGEQVSAYLLGKEKGGRSFLNKIKRDDGSEITNPKAILDYVRKYYENLFKKENCDVISQDECLKSISKVIGEPENKILTEIVNEKEVYAVLRCMKNRKSPGLDGLPVEFYKTFWTIIKRDFLEVISFVLKNKNVCKMNKGVIGIMPKEGDLDIITNWRPLTLLNVDFKVIAKIITKRLKSCLHLIISPEQFCCVENRSINNLNVLIRDVFCYTNESQIDVALLNLDWSKAFDRVDHEFLFRIMQKFGFDDEFIQMIKMLYLDAESIICVNGNLSDPFPINKSVRQGCPLSMLLFIIYQEVFYRMIKRKLSNYVLKLPNELHMLLLGYADDTLMFITCDEALVECLKIIHEYENASGALLNRGKTSILGLSNWKNRVSWSVNGLNVSSDNCKILGIYHSNSYQKSLDLNWKVIENSINKIIGIFQNRKLTIYQRAIVINSKILAKLWYVVHVYQIPLEYTKIIQKTVFRYLWNSQYEPVARKTMFLPKLRGGNGIIDIENKAKSIMFSTFFKGYREKCYGYQMIIYYCKIRATFMFENERGFQDFTIFTPGYYGTMIEILRKVYRQPDYPDLRTKTIYKFLMNDFEYVPRIENMYPLFNWTFIWKHVNNKYIDKKSREILFKYIHEVLSTRDRLVMMKIKSERECYCGSIETNMHLMYFCPLVKNLVTWLEDLLCKCCTLNTDKMLKILKLDFEAYSKRDENTAMVLVSDFILGLWMGHCLGWRNDDPRVLNWIKGKMLNTQLVNIRGLGKSFDNLFTRMYVSKLRTYLNR